MTNATPIVRPARLTDLDMIVRFNRAMALETEDRPLGEATVTAGVRAALQDRSRCLYFVAELDGRPAGQTMVTFEWSDWRNGLFWWIQSVYVDPLHRRRGVFRALHAHVRALAQADSEVCGLRLYVHDTNHRAMDTYAALGMDVSAYRLCEEGWPTPGA